MTRQGRPFSQHIRVYYADTDAGGIVYHARYLEFAERCRAELLRNISFPLVSTEGNQFVVRRSLIDWHAPARLDDLLLCKTTVSSISGARVSMMHQFLLGEVLTTSVAIDLAYVTSNFRPVRVPLDLASALTGPS